MKRKKPANSDSQYQQIHHPTQQYYFPAIHLRRSCQRVKVQLLIILITVCAPPQLTAARRPFEQFAKIKSDASPSPPLPRRHCRCWEQAPFVLFAINRALLQPIFL
jgi:hypothetical protein